MEHEPEIVQLPTLPPYAASTTLTLGGVSIAPGKRIKVEIPIARLPSGKPLSLPVAVLRGRYPGPCLWLSGAIHGDEVNGVEIIRRVIRPLKTDHLQGTILAVPMVNIFGLLNHADYLSDCHDLHRSFPGSAQGSLATQLASIFMKEIVSHCTHGIDLRTAPIHRINFPRVRGNFDNPIIYQLAKAFGAPMVIHGMPRKASLQAAAAKRHIPTLLYEGGEALRFSEKAIKVGVEGVQRVLAYLNMYGIGAPINVPIPIESRATRWEKAPRGGFWHHKVTLGKQITQRQVLGFITDSFGTKLATVHSPLDGWVIGYNQCPLIHKGDVLVHMAVRGGDRT